MTDAKKAVRIVIADDHAIFRDGLKALLSADPEFEVAGEAANGDEALQAVASLRPDILLLDLVMPKTGGMHVLLSLSDTEGKTKTVLLSGEVEGGDISKAFELGARGLVLKDAATSTLLECIRTVLSGKYWIGRQKAENLDEALKHCRGTARRGTPEKYGLTPREMEVIKAVVSGSTNKEIAGQLSISEQTVKHHITSIFDKLGVYNRLELTLFVFHHGILEK
jgi:DNA-binding NarL/FixJ family response regulator